MKNIIRISVAALALAALPAIGHAIDCGPGGIPVTVNGVPGCFFPNGPGGGGAPEISSSATYAGMALLIGGAFMVRGRKRRIN